MVVTRAGANKQMEEELVAIKSKLKDLDKKFIGLNRQHSPMDNRHQPESSTDTRFSLFNHYRGLKLDFPCFDGNDSTRWIYREKQYFYLHNTFDFNKVPLASFHLEHEAHQWFHWYIKAHAELNWTEFSQLLLQRFGPSDFDDFIGALTKLRQIGIV